MVFVLLVTLRYTFAHALAPARRSLTAAPAIVAACPGAPPLVTAAMAGMGICSWPKLYFISLDIVEAISRVTYRASAMITTAAMIMARDSILLIMEYLQSR